MTGHWIGDEQPITAADLKVGTVIEMRGMLFTVTRAPRDGWIKLQREGRDAVAFATDAVELEGFAVVSAPIEAAPEAACRYGCGIGDDSDPSEAMARLNRGQRCHEAPEDLSTGFDELSGLKFPALVERARAGYWSLPATSVEYRALCQEVQRREVLVETSAYEHIGPGTHWLRVESIAGGATPYVVKTDGGQYRLAEVLASRRVVAGRGGPAEIDAAGPRAGQEPRNEGSATSGTPEPSA